MRTDCDKSIMDNLFKLAEASPNDTRAQLAACVVYKKEIISYGFNRKKSHPFQAKFGINSDAIFLHAETDAIKNAIRKIGVDKMAKATLYVARVKKPYPRAKTMVGGLAKPCQGCAKAISTYAIRRVVWSVDDGGFECCET
jgi:tRNA(Arg) A34 adenosine deaminase TadA